MRFTSSLVHLIFYLCVDKLFQTLTVNTNMQALMEITLFKKIQDAVE